MCAIYFHLQNIPDASFEFFVGRANRKSWPTYLLRNFYCAEFLLYRSAYLIMEYYLSIDSLSHFPLRISRTKKERYTLTLVGLRCARVQPSAP